ncbi:hypothetical protein CONPUDRAFT_168298 [Coniophora puteana RWD-64-598 SS2]|uniref:DUF7330 domain-containing protein n=1 Tax=Coniophora puteana (strain RWD-64-598) TaxID=741705 RepID=A0A5M3MFG0_CONPW|nr:uncharacterized protein CONPUDRAFT_168298 [Coniophora puteana RWD-64-598 SS2]EIW77355.1 hypothetical protein CONPUDRAFT_168298 [Coniophora puteana RWD-64-598 SS2]
MVVITNKDNTRSVSKAEQVAGLHNQHEFDPPPSYASAASDSLRNRDLPPTPSDSLPSPSTPTTPSQLTRQASSARQLFKPTNYFYLSESHKSIKGSYAIDPFLALPLALLPALPAGEPESSRKHLKWTVGHGHVKTDVTVVGREVQGELDVSLAEGRKKVDMEVDTSHGNIELVLRTIGRLPPLHLSVQCRHGNMSVAIPRTFEGLLRVEAGTHSKFRMSDELWAACTSLGQVHGQGRWFVGDVAALVEAQEQEPTTVEGAEQVTELMAGETGDHDNNDMGEDAGTEHLDEDDSHTVTGEARGRKEQDERTSFGRGAGRGSGRGWHRGRGTGRFADRGGRRGGPGFGGRGRGRGRGKWDDRSRSRSNSRSHRDNNSRSRSRERSRERRNPDFKMTSGSQSRKGGSGDARLKGDDDDTQEKEDWAGDEVTLLGKHARIWIEFEGEKMKDKGKEKEKEKVGEKKEGFFERIFGRTKSEKQDKQG